MACRADTSIKIQALSLLLSWLLKIVLTFSQLVFCYSWNLSLFLYFKHFQMTSAYRPHNRAKKIIRSHFKFIKDFIISRDSYAMKFEVKLNTRNIWEIIHCFHGEKGICIWNYPFCPKNEDDFFFEILPLGRRQFLLLNFM